MGLFDRLFNRTKKEEEVTQEIPKVEKQVMPEVKNNVSARYITDNGESFLQIDFEDNSYGKLKDTTRLVVSTIPSFRMGEEAIYKAVVFYYDSGWAIMLDEQGRGPYDHGPEEMRNGEYGIIGSGAVIQLGIDFEKALTDKTYQEFLMTKLLEESRVTKYMYEGLQENSGRKSGNYIGEVSTNENGQYIKHFNLGFGEWAHNSPERFEKIQDMREMEANRKEMQILEEQKKIEKAQARIDALRNGTVGGDGER